MTRWGYFSPKWLFLASVGRGKFWLGGTRQITKRWLFLNFQNFTRAYISGEILSRCTFGETNFLLILLISFIWCPIPILMPFSCSLGSICIIEFHFFSFKIQKMILIKNLLLQTCTVRVSLLKCRL